MAKLLSTAYFPPVSYFAAIAEEMDGLIRYKGEDRNAIPSSPLSASRIFIECCENYQKQSYRNRCLFYAADGVQSLSVPVIHNENGHRQPISEIKIDYRKPWLQQHKRAIVSAYHTSAYFEYYQDELFDILDSRPERLIDLNTALLQFFLDKTGVAADLYRTESFEAVPSIPHCEDLREKIHPKRPDDTLERLGLLKPYFQVFSDRYGFKPNLSIMDLLFNEGPDSILYLKKL